MNHKREDFDYSEFGKRILEEMRQENEQVGPCFPDFIGRGSSVCALDRPDPGKANGKGVCECFGDLLPIKRMMILKYIRRDKAEIDALRAVANAARELEMFLGSVCGDAESPVEIVAHGENSDLYATAIRDRLNALQTALKEAE